MEQGSRTTGTDDPDERRHDCRGGQHGPVPVTTSRARVAAVGSTLDIWGPLASVAFNDASHQGPEHRSRARRNKPNTSGLLSCHLQCTPGPVGFLSRSRTFRSSSPGHAAPPQAHPRRPRRDRTRPHPRRLAPTELTVSTCTGLGPGAVAVEVEARRLARSLWLAGRGRGRSAPALVAKGSWAWALAGGPPGQRRGLVGELSPASPGSGGRSTIDQRRCSTWCHQPPVQPTQAAKGRLSRTATVPSASAVIPIASHPSAPSRFNRSTDADAPGVGLAGSKVGSEMMRYSHVAMAKTLRFPMTTLGAAQHRERCGQRGSGAAMGRGHRACPTLDPVRCSPGERQRRGRRSGRQAVGTGSVKKHTW